MKNSNEVMKIHPKVYPYMITRLVPTLYHITVLPVRKKSLLVSLAMTQEMINELETCLVLDESTAIYIKDREITKTSEIPVGGVLLAGKLAPCFDVKECLQNDQSYKTRIETLNNFMKEQKMSGYLFGDLSKGGKIATPEWVNAFGNRKTKPGEIPQGLYQCQKCMDYRGFCIDPNPDFDGMIMTVSCLCDNHNCCANCLKPLNDRKVNANYYNPEDGQVWQVPGFSACSHTCAAQSDNYQKSLKFDQICRT